MHIDFTSRRPKILLRCSVLLHPNIKVLPPTCVAVTEKDPTRQETVWFNEEMKKQGSEADLVE
jgi:acetyl esterase/lipase